MFAFWECFSLRTLRLSQSLKEIEYSAFHACASLNILVIPNTLTDIDQHAFQFCRTMKVVTFPESIDVDFDKDFVMKYCRKLLEAKPTTWKQRNGCNKDSTTCLYTGYATIPMSLPKTSYNAFNNTHTLPLNKMRCSDSISCIIYSKSLRIRSRAALWHR